MGKPDSPDPPDPRQTAAAQTSTNIGTAIAQGALNATNQVTPTGSLTYDQTGTYSHRDPYTGQRYDLPQYTATTALSPEQQGIFDTTQETQQNLANIGRNQSGFLEDYLSQPASLDNSAVEGRLFELGRAQLDPVFTQQQNELEQSLANRGIKMGSEAYTRALDEFGKTRGSAYNDLLLRGRGQAVSELLAQRNQPINEITALLSGSQVSQPNFLNTPQANLPTTDVAGIINNNYNAEMQKYLAGQQGLQSIAGGLFGLGAGALAGGLI